MATFSELRGAAELWAEAHSGTQKACATSVLSEKYVA